MQARMKNAVVIIPEAMAPMQGMIQAVQGQGLPEELLDLVHLRVSQINGCSSCVDGGLKNLRKLGATDERIGLVSAWRETPYYTDAERAALDLAESATRLADRTDAVPDEVWDAAAAHYDDKQLAAILLMIAMSNLFNRLNAPVRQIAGDWG